MHLPIYVSRALELYEKSEYAVQVTDFLSPGEKIEVYNELLARIGNGISRCFFWGGSRGAERCTTVFLPEWYLPEGAPRHKMVADTERTECLAAHLSKNREILGEIPITALKICGSGFRSLGHRDFMGGLLSLGIDRSVVGDIAVLSESEAIVFVSDRIAPFICAELTKIGRDGVTVKTAAVDPEFLIPRRFDETVITVASPRLDGIVKALSGKSREVAAEMVRAGLVELSYSSETDVSAPVAEGDVISIRGYGKYIMGSVLGQTKSGRIRIVCKKYL